MRRVARVNRGAAVSIAVALVVAEAAAAQVDDSSSSQALEEIIVTATKRSEPLQDVPVAVSAISSAAIRERGLTQFADYLNTVPGVYFEDAGPGVSQIRVRGVVATEGSAAVTVATYFGESITSVLTNGGGKPNLRLVDIDRVEVLRGPQGTLFGANSLAGVVRIVPAAPDLENVSVDVGMRGFATAHSADQSYHLEGVLNLPLVRDALALRVVAYKDDIAGYIDNVVPARAAADYSADFGMPAGTLVNPAVTAFTRKDINSEDTWGARAALSWRPTDQLRFDLTYTTQEVTLDSEPQVEPAFGDYVQRRPLDSFEQGEFGEQVDIGTFVIGYDWDAVALVSATGLTKMRRRDRKDYGFLAELFGFGPLPWALLNDSEGELFTEELRLQSRGDGPLQWLAGALYLEQKADYIQVMTDYSCPACYSQAAHGQDFPLRIASGENPRFMNQEQRSIFGEVSYRFAPRWTVGVGARYLEEDLESLIAAYEGFIVDPADGFLEASPSTRGSSHELNPSAYLRFEPAEDMTLYAQAARGFRSGQTNDVLSYSGVCTEDAAAIGLGPLSKPDTLWSYELGMKSRWAEDRIGMNAAVYRHEWQGVQLASSQECGINGTINGGDVRGEGAEVELTARLASAWHLNLAGAYSHNEFDAVRPSTGYVKGERVPGAPETNFSAGMQYDFALNASWSGFARADYVYVGSARYKFGQGEGAEILTQDAYDTVNLRLGMRHRELAVELFARNVTDARAVVTTADPVLGGYQYLLRPRELGIELRYSFD